MASKYTYAAWTVTAKRTAVLQWLELRTTHGATVSSRSVGIGEGVLRKWAAEFQITIPPKSTNPYNNRPKQ